MAATGALDMSLDQVIEAGQSKPRGGKGKGKKVDAAKGSGKAAKRGKNANGAAKEAKASAGGGASAKKLDMSLEDVIDTEWNASKGGKGKGKKHQEQTWQDGGAADSWTSSWGKKEKGGSWGTNGGKGGGGKFGGGSKGGKGGTGDWESGSADGNEWTPPWNQHDDRGGGGGKGKNKGDSWSDEAGGKGDSWNSSWGGGSGRAKGSGGKGVRDDAGWSRVPARGGDDSWGHKPAVGSSSRAGGIGGDRYRAAEDPPPSRGARPATRERISSMADSRNGRSTAAPARTGGGVAGQKRRHEDDAVSDRRTKRIKVTNVPKDLDERDIKDAFEGETGKILQCDMTGSTARIVFSRADDARKAVETFDRGELNGKRITVALEP